MSCRSQISYLSDQRSAIFYCLRRSNSTSIHVAISTNDVLSRAALKVQPKLCHSAGALPTKIACSEAEVFALPHHRRRTASATRFGQCFMFRHGQRTAPTPRHRPPAYSPLPLCRQPGSLRYPLHANTSHVALQATCRKRLRLSESQVHQRKDK